MKTQRHIVIWIGIGVVAMALMFAGQPYQGNAVRHFIMEVMGAFLALAAAIAAFNCSLERREGLTPYIGVAFLAAGLIDLLHALFAMGILLLPHAALDRFIPGSWTAGRTALAVILLVGIIRTGREPDHRPAVARLVLLTSGIAALGMVIFAFFSLPAFILPKLPLLHRPWELVAFALYAACLFIIVRNSDAGLGVMLFPFLALGMLAQITMTISLELFNASFDASHMLKDVSYLAALIPLFRLVHKRSRYSVQVAAARVLAILSVVMIALTLVALTSLTAQKSTENERILYEKQLMLSIRMQRALLELVHPIHEYMLSGDPLEIETFERSWAELQPILSDPVIAYTASEYEIDPVQSFERLRELAGQIFALSDPPASPAITHLNAQMDDEIIGAFSQRLTVVIDHEKMELDELEVQEMAAMRVLLLGQLSALLFVLPAMFVLFVLQIQRQTRPILHLTEITARVKAGESAVRATPTTADEIGVLAATFNRMLDALREGETELRKAYAATETMLAAMPFGVVIVGKDKKIRQVNAIAAEMIGVESGQTLVGTICHQTICPAEDGKCPVVDYGQTVDRSERTLQRTDGSRLPILKTVLPITLEHEEVFLEAFVDISERKEAEEAVRKARDELEVRVRERTEELAQERRNLETAVKARTAELRESLKKIEDANLRLQEANRARSRFLSSMSHELRTPLNGILGFTDLLRGQFFGPLNEKQLGYVNQVDDSGKHLLSLINDLLDMAKIDAGGMELELGPVSAEEFIQATTSMMSSQFKKKEITLRTFLEPGLPVLSADIRKCKQIMLNLLSNALKYTPKGGEVEIGAAAEKDSQLKITVKDTGIGIEADEIEKVFSEFHQADKVRDQQLGGTGIGLALTRRLVELHGGGIGVESEVGAGSAFWFTLPLKRPAAKDAEYAAQETSAAPHPAPAGRRILVAEDNEVNLAMILDMLSIQGHDVVVANNGQEAIELAQSHKPELILMDMRMPVMGGLEATHRLRGMPEFADVPIVALTASTGSDAEDRQITAGCTEHLAKPIQSKELFETLVKYLK